MITVQTLRQMRRRGVDDPPCDERSETRPYPACSGRGWRIGHSQGRRANLNDPNLRFLP